MPPAPSGPGALSFHLHERHLPRAALAYPDGGLASVAAVGGAGLHRSADAGLLCARPRRRAGGGGGPAVRAGSAGRHRPLLCLDHPRHAASGAAFPDLLRPAQRRHRAGRLPGGADRLHAECRRLHLGDHPCRHRLGAEGPVGGRLFHRHELVAGDAPNHPAAGRPRRRAAAVQQLHLAGEGHLARRRHHRAGAVSGRPAHRRHQLRAADPLCGGGADLSRAQFRPVGAAGPAGKAAQPVWRFPGGQVVIRLSNIEKRFGDLTVLKGVSVTVAEGRVTALIGPSGGGKSTLLRCINLLEIPTSGTVRIGEEELSFQPGGKPGWKDIQRLRGQTGMVFQNFQLFPHRTAVENVMEGLVTVQKWPAEKARDRAMALLRKVGMAHKADAWPATLSGGQQQRVAIARALAPSPRVLLCDEPTSALDPELSGEVVEVLGTLAAEGTTMVMATHDLRLASRIAHEVVFLDAGQVVESGPSRTLFTHPTRERTQRFIATLTLQGQQGEGV
ncbi:hypothetical protein Lal_00013816 [Lupinus albus]|nr:hypothetical protein Lal_00013816 [Lupinus albus]